MQYNNAVMELVHTVNQKNQGTSANIRINLMIIFIHLCCQKLAH